MNYAILWFIVFFRLHGFVSGRFEALWNTKKNNTFSPSVESNNTRPTNGKGTFNKLEKKGWIVKHDSTMSANKILPQNPQSTTQVPHISFQGKKHRNGVHLTNHCGNNNNTNEYGICNFTRNKTTPTNYISIEPNID